MEDVDNDAVDLLIKADQISLGELSPPSNYDTIRFSRSPLINTQADFKDFDDLGAENEAFALNFSNPPREFRNHVEYLIEDCGKIGSDFEEWCRETAKSLAETALEAGQLGKKVQGCYGYVLMSDINEEMDAEEFNEKSDIPDYFLEESDLNSKYHLFEGVLNRRRDRKIASITEDETSVAWLVGRTLEEFDIEDDFTKAYTQRIEDYVAQKYPERI